ncbi:hypothetical protein [Roseomonas sp. BN140053]|uniref:hypothetical protein n=1 Tax=Roseomonas sp. BN140053 TaxID=3391898 RepID=UPI0039E9C474
MSAQSSLRQRALPDAAPSQPSAPLPFPSPQATPGLAFRPSLFRSFFMGGFECSTHTRGNGQRLDLSAGTQHDRRVEEDYRQLAEMGIRSVRDGLRWHLIERSPGQYDWSSLLPMLRAAEKVGTQVSWDLCHYGWPDGLDVFSGAFVERFARFCHAFAGLHLEETGRAPIVCPVNEISFLAWAGGDHARMPPRAHGRGNELKRQLVRCVVAATHAVREAAPGARFLAIDPIIHIAPRPGHEAAAESYNQGQFQAWDMLAGRLDPELGGGPEILDVVGINYYWNNQWLDGGEPLSPFDPRFRPLHELLLAAHARYGRPVFLSETSIEGDRRAGWLRYVGEEVRIAMRAGLPLEGFCFYPVLSHLGWDDDRYCDNGLLEVESRDGKRVVDEPLAAEFREQRRLFAAMGPGMAAAVG